jgi:diguanylate cyclase (GGDEF)-like protein/PAS domain S-box-containing protein
MPTVRLKLAVLAAAAVTALAIVAAALLPRAGYALVVDALMACVVAAGNSALVLRFGLSPLRVAFAGEQRKTATLLDAVPEGIVEVDATGTIVYSNRPICELFGYRSDELVGQNIDILVPQRARGGHAASRTAFFDNARSRAMGSGLDIAGLRKDGTEVAVDISLSRLDTRSGPVMYCLVRDNSVRKAFESQLLDTNKRLLSGVASLERNAFELNKLTEMGDLLHSSTTLKELFDIAAHTISGLFPRLSGALLTLSDTRSTATVAASWGSEAAALRSAISRDDCWALRRSRPHSTVLEADEPRCLHYIDGVARPCRCVPLLGHGDLLGVLHLFASDFSCCDELTAPSRVQFIHALANQVSLSTANLRLRESLVTQSIVDPLTGLYNRRIIDDWFEREIKNALGAGRALSVLAIDIDHFKNFNDRHGHECGDIALRAIGSLLKMTLRAEDIACRLGGEEFAVLLPDTDRASAGLVAEKLRRAVEAMPLERSGRSFGQMTVSIGVAALGGEAGSAASLLRQADRALYRAKSGGRNRVVLSADGEDTGMIPLLSAAPRRA